MVIDDVASVKSVACCCFPLTRCELLPAYSSYVRAGAIQVHAQRQNPFFAIPEAQGHVIFTAVTPVEYVGLRSYVRTYDPPEMGKDGRFQEWFGIASDKASWEQTLTTYTRALAQ